MSILSICEMYGADKMELPVVDERGNAFFIEFDVNDPTVIINEDRFLYTIHTINGTYRYATTFYELAAAIESKKQGFIKTSAKSIVNINTVTEVVTSKIGQQTHVHFPPVGKDSIDKYLLTKENRQKVLNYREGKL